MIELKLKLFKWIQAYYRTPPVVRNYYIAKIISNLYSMWKLGFCYIYKLDRRRRPAFYRFVSIRICFNRFFRFSFEGNFGLIFH